MTPGANAVTERARRSAAMPATHGSQPPVVPAGQVRAFTAALERLGYDPLALLAGVGLGPGDVGQADATVPCQALGRLLCNAVQEGRVANLGARTAAVTPIGAYPLLDYLVVTADTVGDALEQLVRYFHVAAAPARLRLAEVTAAVRLVVEPGDDPFLAEYETSIVLHHLRAETEHRLGASFVSLMHEPDDVAALERLLACRVRTHAEWSGIEFSKAAMHTPLRRRDPVLRGLLEGHAADVTSRASADGAPSLGATVRAALAGRLASSLSLSDIARQLGMAQRTLQRRLAAEGASFGSLLDDVRREAAERLLAAGSLAIADVGYLLGFSEPSAFHRAFRRWNAETPQEYRRRTMPATSSPRIV